MPPRAPSKNGDLPSLGDKGRDLEYRRTSRHHQPSRFAREKPLSPRASQSLKFKDKGVRIENPIRPPYADLPLEFVKNDENGYSVQAKYSGNHQHLDSGRTNASSEDELIKYMSKVPKYLQKEEKIQDSVLNFGVLDWGRLEKWTNKQSQCSTSNTGSSVPSKVDFSPIVRPMKGKAVKPSDMVNSSSVRNKKHVNYGKDQVRVIGVDIKSDMGKEMDQKQKRHGKIESSERDCVDLKSSKGKEKCLYQDSIEVLGRSNKKLDNQDPQPENCSKHFEERDLDSSNEQAGTVFLLPKDFSRPCSSEMPQKTSLNGKSSQHNWGSFSDFFSIDEIQTNKPSSDIPHSCSPNHTVETEKDLDVKLDNLIKSQGVELPLNSESNGSDQIAPRCSVELDGESSKNQRLGFRLSRMTRSLSFKESSLHPPLNSTYVTAKSGPAKPETPNNSNSNIYSKARSNPFKRLLNPILKSKEHSSDSRMKPPIPIVVPEVEKSEPLTIKALLHLTVKSGLPLFKFVVETNNEILASTVKSLSSFGKDDIILMYTFYSVHKIRKKTSGWKNQKVKPCEFGYNVVGQMKVSKPEKSSCKVKESVLCSADVSKTSDVAASDFVTGRELAAIIVNMPNETRKCDDSRTDSNEGLFDCKDEKLAQTLVILPGGDHSLPNEGIPSSLIHRWRTGGLCDCGGWDEGCKLRTLTDKGLIRPRSRLMDFRCDLYDQGESEQSSPFFRLVPFRDGLFSVEFDAKMSSLQAFSVCVAVINSKQPSLPSESKPESGERHERHTHSHPPHSPAGRV